MKELGFERASRNCAESWVQRSASTAQRRSPGASSRDRRCGINAAGGRLGLSSWINASVTRPGLRRAGWDLIVAEAATAAGPRRETLPDAAPFPVGKRLAKDRHSRAQLLLSADAFSPRRPAMPVSASIRPPWTIPGQRRALPDLFETILRRGNIQWELFQEEPWDISSTVSARTCGKKEQDSRAKTLKEAPKGGFPPPTRWRWTRAAERLKPVSLGTSSQPRQEKQSSPEPGG